MHQHVPYIVADPKFRVLELREYAGRTHPCIRVHACLTLGVIPAYAGHTRRVPNFHIWPSFPLFPQKDQNDLPLNSRGLTIKYS